jgi:hypothetical protein
VTNRRVDKRSAIDHQQSPIIHTNNHGAIDHLAAIKKSLLIHHTNFQSKATLKI